MKLDQDSKKVVKWVVLGTVSLALLLLFIFFVLGKISKLSILGIALGSGISLLNFWLLTVTLQKALGKGTKGKGIAGFSYTGRMLLQMLLVILSITLLKVPPISVLVPLVFPRISIFFFQMHEKFLERGKENHGC